MSRSVNGGGRWRLGNRKKFLWALGGMWRRREDETLKWWKYREFGWEHSLIFVDYSKWRRIVDWVWVYEGFDLIGMSRTTICVTAVSNESVCQSKGEIYWRARSKIGEFSGSSSMAMTSSTDGLCWWRMVVVVLPCYDVLVFVYLFILFFR